MAVWVSVRGRFPRSGVGLSWIAKTKSRPLTMLRLQLLDGIVRYLSATSWDLARIRMSNVPLRLVADSTEKKETMIDRTFPLCKGIILRRGVVKYSHRVNLTARKVVNGLQETIYIRYNVGNWTGRDLERKTLISRDGYWCIVTCKSYRSPNDRLRTPTSTKE